MKQLDRSCGFVTASVSMLLLGLSIVTMAFLAYVMNESAATQKTINQLDIDHTIENVFLSAVVRMLETGDLQTTETHPIGRANAPYTFRAVATEEALKQDVLRAPKTNLEAAMETYLTDDTARTLLKEASFSARQKVGNHAEIFDRIRNSDALNRSSWWCFSRHFTYFQPPSRVRRANSDRSLQGEMFSIQVSAQHEGRNVRVLDAVILLTGREAAPFWIYRWEKYSGVEARNCTDEPYE